ncbi:hypothetical protein GCM10022251_17600 [Phytohabitans flavus]|uniref:Uncharacterized protein n=1 Tax=Phytohabitans flavus TaxID=1076124 RepID=A0A6F8Y5T6_9ACTN|nr:hypothetical protein [Phytohabitans flavus]BCB81476.1 hypothetical protein Pflav_078860 [Phytohabitans flavus]
MKPHRTDSVSLTFALLFLAIAAWWFIAQLLDLSLPAVGWFVAGALIFLGVLGLMGALRSGKSEPPPPAEPTPEPAIAPVSGLPAELHADIVRELLAGPQTPYLPPVSGVPETTKRDSTSD